MQHGEEFTSLPGSETAAAAVLWRWSYVEGSVIAATDDELGSLKDLYFDDESWTVRYLVVDTGRWLPGRQVLISPQSIERVDLVGRRVLAGLTRAQIEASPGIDRARPVSRQLEIDLARFWSYPYYWDGPYRWGPTPLPAARGGAATPADLGAADTSRDDPRLRNVGEILGYGIRASDGELGQVEDLLVEEGCWAIRYLIVDPRNWWPGQHVLIATEWITDVDWRDETVGVGVSRDAVRRAPAFDPRGALSRADEVRLHEHHDRAGYWDRVDDAWKFWRAA